MGRPNLAPEVISPTILGVCEDSYQATHYCGGGRRAARLRSRVVQCAEYTEQ